MITTPEESEKLAEFRSRVFSIYPECDKKLLNWLRARELNVDKAEQMLRRHLIWRRHNEIDLLKTWVSPKCFLPYLHSGYDYEKCPVFILPIGRWEMRACVETGDFVPSLKYTYQCLELHNSAAYSNEQYEGVFICDFDGFGYRQLGSRTVIQGMMEIMRVFEANYPECLKAIYVINAPKLFHVVFNLIKPLLNSRTLSKLNIFGPDREKWQTVLFKVVPKDQIPQHWGGSKVGSDSFCSSAWHGESLHPCFMRKLSMTTDEYGEDLYTLKVNPGDKVELDFNVAEDQADKGKLKWYFSTDGYDIGFSLSRESEGDDNAQQQQPFYLIPNQRVDSHVRKVEGEVRLRKCGKYRMTFDNSYSRSRAKTLHCSVNLVWNEVKDQKKEKNDPSMDNGITTTTT